MSRGAADRSGFQATEIFHCGGADGAFVGHGDEQRDAETLIYLEGLSTSSTMQAGQTLCVDGKRNRS